MVKSDILVVGCTIIVVAVMLYFMYWRKSDDE
jgi:hypothetical protein